MDIRKVKKLIEMLEESKINEIEIHEGEESVRISRTSGGAPQAYIQVPTGIEQSQQASSPNSSTLVSGAKSGEQETGHIVKSPMVGTYYSSPTPGTPPFVAEGQSVKTGDVICIIEAMKIMNQIEADADGVIKKILVENGEPVEYGQPLFIVE